MAQVEKGRSLSDLLSINSERSYPIAEILRQWQKNKIKLL